MTDLHTHIAPHIDDGADDTEQALLMLEIAARNGTDTMVLTPHYPNRIFGFERSALEYIDFLNEAIDKLSALQSGVKLYSGAEIYCGEGLEQMLTDGGIITLAGSRYVLCEFATQGHFSNMRHSVELLTNAGYIPVIAHTERYACLQYSPERVVELKRLGCKLQINTETVLGKNSMEALRLGRFILSNALADVVASDAHNTYNRSPDMSAANAEICLNYSPDYAEILFEINPQKILLNEEF